MRSFIFFALLAGCASSSPWHVDAIASGTPQFDASRLIYRAQPHAPLAFELTRMGGQVDAFFSLSRFRLSPDRAKLVLTIEGESIAAEIVPHEGQMRLRLPPEIASLLIQALQEGKKVGILLDGFEETLDPAQFGPSFARFLAEGGL